MIFCGTNIFCGRNNIIVVLNLHFLGLVCADYVDPYFMTLFMLHHESKLHCYYRFKFKLACAAQYCINKAVSGNTLPNPMCSAGTVHTHHYMQYSATECESYYMVHWATIMQILIIWYSSHSALAIIGIMCNLPQKNIIDLATWML